MAKSNYEICSDFVNQVKEHGHNLSTSFSNNRYYSYSTVVGQLFETKDNEQIVLLSSNTMSATTGKHLSDLRWACHQNGIKYIEVPCYWRDYSAPSIQDYADRLKEDLLTYVNDQSLLRLKPNREDFITCYNTLLQLQELFRPKQVKVHIGKKIETVYNNLFNTDYIKSLKKKARVEKVA